ncbi:MAG: transposase [Chloroflexi bacterium]|nr:transposase [Chloroflexota bacterium]
MTFTDDRPSARHTLRLTDYDYSQPGAYFLTLCTYDKKPLLGEVLDGQVKLSQYGSIIEREWLRTSEIRSEVELDEFVIMPNHLHCIVFFKEPQADRDRAHGRAPLQEGASDSQDLRKPRSLGSLVAGFKSAATTQINALRGTPGVPVWQRNYYEHVIRNEEELQRVRHYVLTNPTRWELDSENPDRMPQKKRG